MVPSYLTELRDDLIPLISNCVHVHVQSEPGMGKSTTVLAVLDEIAAGAEVILIAASPDVESPELLQSLTMVAGTTGERQGPLYVAAALAAEGRRVVVRVTEAQYLSVGALSAIASLTDAECTLRLPFGGVVRFPPKLLSLVIESNPPWHEEPALIKSRFVLVPVGKMTAEEVAVALHEDGLPEAGPFAAWWERCDAKGIAPSLRRFSIYRQLRLDVGLTAARAAKLAFSDRADTGLTTALAAFYPLRAGLAVAK